MTKDISLVIVDNFCHNLAKFSIEQTLQHIDCRKVLTFSDREIISGATLVPIKKSISMVDYAQVMLKHLWLHVDTEHILIVQWDGMAVDRDQWDDEYLKYDYIGSPWGDGLIGNGGFSLRSRKLLDCLRDNQIQITSDTGQDEDIIICKHYRSNLEKQGIKFAPTELANKFSIEHQHTGDTFGFHGIWNAARYFDIDTLRFIQRNWPEYMNSSSKKYLWDALLQQRGISL
jgi:Protein of unknown function (DUF5672)